MESNTCIMGAVAHSGGKTPLKAKQTGHGYPGNTECDFFFFSTFENKWVFWKRQQVAYVVSDTIESLKHFHQIHK